METTRTVSTSRVMDGCISHNMRFLAVIGKRFGEASLYDLLVESGVVESSSVDSVLSGKHYN